VFPLPNAVLGSLSMQGYFLTALEILLLLVVPTAIVIACLLVKEQVRQVQYPMDFIALRIPILGQAVYQLSICRYTKAFGMLYKAGVPMIESTTRANQAVGNAIVAGQFAGGMESVRQGGMAWEGFSPKLPTEYRHLWQVGEEVGELDKTVDKIAEISGDRADLLFTEFARWLPRLVYAMVSVMLIIMIMKLAGQVYGNMPTF
jgi:type II secretory pathway component PulF